MESALKLMLQKKKKSIILTPPPIIGPQNLSFWQILFQRYFQTANMNTSWKFDNSMTKDEQEVLFSNFGLFEDPQDRSPEQGPKSKFRSNNFVWLMKESKYWKNENPSWKTDGEVLFLAFGPFWASFGP